MPFLRIICWFCFAFFYSLLAWCAPSSQPPETGRPKSGAGPTQVGMTTWFSDISKIDSAAQTFSASLIFRMRWQDPSLAHPGLGVKTYPLDQVWHPRWIIANAGADLRNTLPETVDVAPDGEVVYRQRLIGTFSQPLNLRRFPFDREVFAIKLIALGATTSEIEFIQDADAISSGLKGATGRSPTISMQDWNVSELDSQTAPYSLLPGTDLAGYDVAFAATRLPQHYLLKVILPLILIVFMSWTVFWIDPTLGSSQISVAVTSMLTLIAYRFAIGTEVPKLPYLTHLDAFILAATVLVFLSLIEVMVTTRLALNNKVKTARSVDRHSRWVFPLTFAILSALSFLP